MRCSCRTLSDFVQTSCHLLTRELALVYEAASESEQHVGQRGQTCPWQRYTPELATCGFIFSEGVWTKSFPGLTQIWVPPNNYPKSTRFIITRRPQPHVQKHPQMAGQAGRQWHKNRRGAALAFTCSMSAWDVGIRSPSIRWWLIIVNRLTIYTIRYNRWLIHTYTMIE